MPRCARAAPSSPLTPLGAIRVSERLVCDTELALVAQEPHSLASRARCTDKVQTESTLPSSGSTKRWNVSLVGVLNQRTWCDPLRVTFEYQPASRIENAHGHG